MNSYQRLKKENENLHQEIAKILDDEVYYLTAKIKRGIRKDIERVYFFGGIPVGVLKDKSSLNQPKKSEDNKQ